MKKAVNARSNSVHYDDESIKIIWTKNLPNFCVEPGEFLRLRTGLSYILTTGG